LIIDFSFEDTFKILGNIVKTMRKISICVGSQTPVVRFKLTSEDLFEKYGDLPEPVSIDGLVEGEDYDFTPGGVTGMVKPLLEKMHADGKIKRPHWVAINPLGPERAMVGGIVLHRIEMEPLELAGYGHFKERMWRSVHGLEETEIPRHYFRDFALLNWLYAKKMLDLNLEFNFDLFYVHDFQLLLIGSMVGPAAPKVFRWHIPIDVGNLSPEWRSFLLRYLEEYDAVIVSCKKYKKSLLRAGFKGKVYQFYPHLDQRAHEKAPAPQVNQFCEKFGIRDGNKVVVVVARLDPIKGQDIAIKALARVVKRFPNTKLVLVGDGSFSSARRGGIGLPKGSKWLAKLMELTRRLGIHDNVIFTHYLTFEDLRSAYTRADLVVLPSRLEGFGLVVVEGWLYKKPAIISSGAGIAELVVEGKNGYLFNPNKPEELARKIINMLSKPKQAGKMGEGGFETASKCYLEKGIRSLQNVFLEALGER